MKINEGYLLLVKQADAMESRALRLPTAADPKLEQERLRELSLLTDEVFRLRARASSLARAAIRLVENDLSELGPKWTDLWDKKHSRM